jgi:hypothetical protein
MRYGRSSRSGAFGWERCRKASIVCRRTTLHGARPKSGDHRALPRAGSQGRRSTTPHTISAACASCRRPGADDALAQAAVRAPGAHRQLGPGFLRQSPGPGPCGGAESTPRVLIGRRRRAPRSRTGCEQSAGRGSPAGGPGPLSALMGFMMPRWQPPSQPGRRETQVTLVHDGPTTSDGWRRRRGGIRYWPCGSSMGLVGIAGRALYLRGNT